MKKYSLIIILLPLFLFYSAFAQEYKLSGKVIESKNNLPVEYVNVLLLQKDSIYGGTITDNLGFFSVVVPKGGYTLRLEQFGKVFLTKKVEVLADTDLGELQTELSLTLSEVVVKSDKPLIQQKIDRLEFNVENTVIGSNSNALEVLRVIPGISLQNNTISIVGKQSVRVLVNDRMVYLTGEELNNYLSSLASDDIKSIEVITTPPAKYDAEGNSGLINIILKKVKNDTWNNRVQLGYVQTTYPALKLGNIFNYGGKKTTLYASINTKKGNEQRLEQFQIFYPDEIWKDTIVAKERKDFVSGKLGIDYNLTTKSTIGFLYSASYQFPDRNEHSHTQIYNQQIVGHIANEGHLKASSNNNVFNVYYVQVLDDLDRKISLDLDYFTYNNNRDRLFSSRRTGIVTSSQESRNTNNQNIVNYSAKMDVEHPFSWANLNYGIKFTQTKTDNEVIFYNLISNRFTVDYSRTDAFEYTENIKAVYLDLAKNFNSKWQMKLGLRLETTQTKGFSKILNQTNKIDYTKLFPTAYINYIKDQDNIFNLSYSRRVGRPAFWQLNPFRFYLNDNSYAEGNPFLEPAISNNVEIKYIRKNKYITDLFITHTESGFGQISRIDVNDKKQIYTQQNYYYGYVYGLRQTILFNPFSWWNTTNMFATFSTNMESIKDVFFISKMQNGWNFQLYSNQIFLLNSSKTIQAEATFMANAKGNTSVYETEPYAWLDLGIRMQLMDRRLQVNFRVSDIFKSSSPDVTTYTSDVRQLYNVYTDNRYFTLGISYSLGNTKVNVKERDTGNKEQLRRVY